MKYLAQEIDEFVKFNGKTKFHYRHLGETYKKEGGITNNELISFLC